MTQGAPRWWTRATDSGRRLRCAFCPTCGSRAWHEPEGGGDAITVRAGSLDEPVDAGAAIHIWTSRKLPGIEIPADAAQYPEEPA